MLSCYCQSPTGNVLPLYLLTKEKLGLWLATQQTRVKNWVKISTTGIKAGYIILLPNHCGEPERVIVIIDKIDNPWAIAHLASSLPQGDYFIENRLDADILQRLTIGWGLGAYQFNRYKKPSSHLARLVIPVSCEATIIDHIVSSYYFGRDLINTPANDLGPEQLANVACDLAKRYHAKCEQIIGEDLLEKNYPAIYTVGQASSRLPRLIDLQWGDEHLPLLTLVGKGVCFDSGGLLVKPGQSMALMKKDMGGAAHVLALARLIMAENLPIRLRVLIPAVENAISGNAYRPGDIITMGNRKTVEVIDTDAEGRLILADALAQAATEKPALLVDMATLTGAARIALGTEVPVMFASHDSTAFALETVAKQKQDPIWRLPLYKPYYQMLNSDIADIANHHKTPYGGAIVAALFLQAFVPSHIDWLHFDIMAWNLNTKPGRPKGGEIMALQTLWHYLCQRFNN